MFKLNFRLRWQLVWYDLIIFLLTEVGLFFIYSNDSVSLEWTLPYGLIALICIFFVRILGNIYGQIWRYGGIQCYLRLILADAVAFFVTALLSFLLPYVSTVEAIHPTHLIIVACVNLITALTMRMVYRYAYKKGSRSASFGNIWTFLIRMFAGNRILGESKEEAPKIKIAIVGAGRVGVSLAEELLANRRAAYVPRCFVDVNVEKAGREIHGIPVILEDDETFARLREFEVQEIVFAINGEKSIAKRKMLYDKYHNAGYKTKVYDYPVMQSEGQRRHLREFDIEDLLFRKQIAVLDEKTQEYYRDKVVLITGGGGSIGSELCRQLAKMQPKSIVILDIYENGAYDVQQELKMKYGSELSVNIEICSITNFAAMKRVFLAYRPQILINAAAHKHVPLMEHNCVEAVENNVFGTENLITLCEQFGVERFMMVSTDKAVNPTNVMGATKRMCEMMVQSASVYGKTKYSSTRFGNVLGSAGSVIPLFKKQILGGGPITITDKRIIRYFMTIPEAAQLVLQSGAMANNGELFVLDMGQPVKILDLAQNMIQLSGAQDIEIIETGLRPGEKLYEELLMKKEELDKTENELIFIERDHPLGIAEIEKRLNMLRKACETGDDDMVRAALHSAVPTFKSPQEVNVEAERTEENVSVC